MKETEKKKFLICFDSDGCAIDSMTIKHEKAFGPAFVEVWQIPMDKKEEILKAWNDMNLYTMTRGINRFQGLVEILSLYPHFVDTFELDALRNWTLTTPALSADALKVAYEQNGLSIMGLALEWSELVNIKINQLPLAIPFEHVFDTLSSIKDNVDIAVVSSANRVAIEEEWKISGLFDLVDYFFSQSDGTKSDCIKKLLQEGYLPENTLMVGDAMGDHHAAEKNNVWFYPILAGHEVLSWWQLKTDVIPQFIEEKFTKDLQSKFVTLMKENLTK